MNTTITYLTTKEAARILSFSFKTLEAWRTTGTGPEYLRLENGHIRYKREALDEWLHMNTSKRAA